MRPRLERPCLVLKSIICLHIYEHIDKVLPLNSFRLADTVALSALFSWDCINYLLGFLSLLKFEGEMLTYRFTSSLYTEATAYYVHYFAFGYPYSSNYRFVAHCHQAIVCNLTEPVWVCWLIQWFSLLPLGPWLLGLFACFGLRWKYGIFQSKSHGEQLLQGLPFAMLLDESHFSLQVKLLVALE